MTFSTNKVHHRISPTLPSRSWRRPQPALTKAYGHLARVCDHLRQANSPEGGTGNVADRSAILRAPPPAPSQTRAQSGSGSGSEMPRRVNRIHADKVTRPWPSHTGQDSFGPSAVQTIPSIQPEAGHKRDRSTCAPELLRISGAVNATNVPSCFRWNPASPPRLAAKGHAESLLVRCHMPRIDDGRSLLPDVGNQSAVTSPRRDDIQG